MPAKGWAQATTASNWGQRVCIPCKLYTWVQSLSKNNRHCCQKTLSAAPMALKHGRSNSKNWRGRMLVSFMVCSLEDGIVRANPLAGCYIYIFEHISSSTINWILWYPKGSRKWWVTKWLKWFWFWNATVDFHVAQGSRRVGGGSGRIPAAPGAGATRLKHTWNNWQTNDKHMTTKWQRTSSTGHPAASNIRFRR